MNFTKRFLGFGMLEVVLALALIVASLGILSPPALAQVTPTTGGTITTTNVFRNASTYTINSTPVAVRKDRGLGILASLTGADTNAATLNVQVSNDKTNWAAATPFSLPRKLTVLTTN